jgi:hypothetical protein
MVESGYDQIWSNLFSIWLSWLALEHEAIYFQWQICNLLATILKSIKTWKVQRNFLKFSSKTYLVAKPDVDPQQPMQYSLYKVHLV